MTTSVSGLTALVAGTVLERGQPGYDEEVVGFNAAVTHRPEVVVGASSTADVVAAVRFARARGWRVGVHSTGHGAAVPVEAGLLVTTRRIDRVAVDGAARAAVAGAGARWATVVASAAPYGLASIAGSSPSVGVVGFLLGGGIGPLARSHGFGSDHLVGATLVTGNGDVVLASGDENADILWVLRGGKPGLGVVTEVRLRLVELPALYAGSLFFAEAHIEGAQRAWIAIQVYDDLWREVTGEATPSLYDRALPNNQFTQFAEDRQIMVVDLLPVLLKEGKTRMGLYYRYEQHWTREGDELVAGVLVERLRSAALAN